jgi:hypothetical protein
MVSPPQLHQATAIYTKYDVIKLHKLHKINVIKVIKNKTTAQITHCFDNEKGFRNEILSLILEQYRTFFLLFLYYVIKLAKD